MFLHSTTKAENCCLHVVAYVVECMSVVAVKVQICLTHMHTYTHLGMAGCLYVWNLLVATTGRRCMSACCY